MTSIQALITNTIITEAILQHGDSASNFAVSALLQQQVGQQQHPQKTTQP